MLPVPRSRLIILLVEELLFFLFSLLSIFPFCEANFESYWYVIWATVRGTDRVMFFSEVKPLSSITFIFIV